MILCIKISVSAARSLPLDVYETDDALHLAAASSTAAMVPRGSAFAIDAETLILMGRDDPEPYCLLGRLRLERRQGRIADCSGFLVDDDLLMTSDHCLGTDGGRCGSHLWVFGYSVSSPRQTGEPFVVGRDQVYACEAVVGGARGSRGFALVRLDRRVEGRTPLGLGTSLDGGSGARFFTVGSPGGLPLKVSSGGVLDEDKTDGFWLSVRLDIFRGNSGGPLVNAETGLVEGVVRNGEIVGSAPVFDEEGGCILLGEGDIYTGADRVVAQDIRAVEKSLWDRFLGYFRL